MLPYCIYSPTLDEREKGKWKHKKGALFSLISFEPRGKVVYYN